MSTLTADSVAAVLAAQPGLAGHTIDADEVLVPLVCPPLAREHALGLELILEGFLLHHGTPRHVSEVDMGAAVLALNGFPISAIADQFPNPRLNRLIVESRQHLGMNIIPAGRTGPSSRRTRPVKSFISRPAASRTSTTSAPRM